MSTQDTIETLRKASAQTKLVKAVVKMTVEQARILMSEDALHEMKDLACDLGSDVATIEHYLNEFSRMGVGNKRFSVK